MVGTNENCKIIITFQKLGYGCEDMLIDKLDSLNLVFHFSSVATLVGSFNVNVNKISTVFEFVNCRLALAVKVGVNVTCCAFNVNTLHTCADCNTL